MEKKCRKCGAKKPISEFYVFKRHGVGKPTSQCKVCICATVERRRELKMATDPDWVVKEAERCRAKQARYRKVGLAVKLSPEHMRKVRQKSAERYPEKVRATVALNNAVKRGDVIKLCCVKCGDRDTEGHHEDYAKPLEVIWLCDKHHKARHVEINDARRRARVEAARTKLQTIILK